MQTTPSSRDRYAYPLPPRLLTIPGVQPLELEVAEVGDAGPRIRRITLGASALDERFSFQAGQDLMVVLGGTLDRPMSRRYTIRRHDPGTRTLELNIVAHGIHGPGAEWAATTQPGDRINGVGPRGKIYLDPDADWHVFIGDETAAPGYLAMLEALPDGVPGTALLSVTSASDELPTSAGGNRTVRWLHRGEVPGTDSSLLEQAFGALTLAAGRGHVYIAAEVQVVAALQRAALARGLASEQVSPKAYWGRAKANANNGEPEREPSA